MITEVKCEDIQDIIIKYFPDFKLSQSPFQKAIVYKLDDIIGFIVYSVMYERAEIDYIAVDERYRGKGVSQKLFDYLLLDLKCESISLEVNSNNRRAISFYVKNGFKEVSVRKNYFKDSDGILMIKKLEVK